jgi:hypothetical protein
MVVSFASAIAWAIEPPTPFFMRGNHFQELDMTGTSDCS